MNSVLNVEVSCFESYAGKYPKTISLLKWLNSDQYEAKIKALRTLTNKAERDQIKASLPAITVSGVFDPTRKAEHLKKHSGLICIDIDWKGNERIYNFMDLKKQLFNIENAAYVGISASGKGFFLIIPIASSEFHKAHFEAIKQDFASLGIIIDPAPKNVASLRGYSWDPKALFRHDAKPYKKKKTKNIGKRNFSFPTPLDLSQDNDSKVKEAIKKIVDHRIDITGNEPHWFRLACALANEFGESGRDYFHTISQFHPNYNCKEADNKFSHALKGQYSQITIGTFFATINHQLWRYNSNF